MNQASAGVPRGSHGGWKPEEVKALKAEVEKANEAGEPLRGVFERVSQRLGRKPNSIRNFYYAQLKGIHFTAQSRAMPFETFTDEEMRKLVEGVLRGRAEGLSVRACVTKMAGGDKTLMLRYQNKFRSLVKTKPDLVREVMDELKAEGLSVRDPFLGRAANRASLKDTQDRLREAADPALQQFLTGLNALLDRAAPKQDAAQQAAAQVTAIKAACQGLQGAAKPLVDSVKGYLSQPGAARRSGLTAFCKTLEEQAASLEAALDNVKTAI